MHNLANVVIRVDAMNVDASGIVSFVPSGTAFGAPQIGSGQPELIVEQPILVEPKAIIEPKAVDVVASASIDYAELRKNLVRLQVEVRSEISTIASKSHSTNSRLSHLEAMLPNLLMQSHRLDALEQQLISLRTELNLLQNEINQRKTLWQRLMEFIAQARRSLSLKIS